MYYPYLRGKRHELAALRRLSSDLDPKKVSPIIEPVKSNPKELIDTINALNESNITPLIILNPLVGDLVNSSDVIELYQENTLQFLPCVAFSQENFHNAEQLANQLISDKVKFSTYFKHEPPQNVSSILSSSSVNAVFTSKNTSHQFLATTPNLVKVQDPIPPVSKNADFSIEPYKYSDAHINLHNSANEVGFGDFQVVGEAYSENGGPARAVAIHITYINSLCDNYMFIKHSVSTIELDSAANPAKKCIQALELLMSFAKENKDVDQSTIGFRGLADYYKRKHYPNLGPIKECSIMHHIETYNNYL